MVNLEWVSTICFPMSRRIMVISFSNPGKICTHHFLEGIAVKVPDGELKALLESRQKLIRLGLQILDDI